MLLKPLSAILLLTSFRPLLSFKPKDLECLPRDSCHCDYPDEWVLDLTSLEKGSPFLTVSNASLVYFYRPCNEFQPTGNLTEKALLWKFEAINVTDKVLDPKDVVNGEVNGTFTSIAAADQVQFQSTYFLRNSALLNCTKPGQEAVIKLVCSDNQTTRFELGPSQPYFVNSLVLTSSAVCSIPPQVSDTGGLSTGSILLLIFFCFAFVYFCGGAIALKYLRGAEGLEMIPNYDFWRELPSLVKDGLIFALSCGRTRPDSYERI